MIRDSPRRGRRCRSAGAGGALLVLALSAGTAAAAPWTAPATRSTPAAEAASPRLAIGADGTAVAVWTRLSGRFRVVEAAIRPAGADWGPPEPVSPAGADASLPVVAVDPTAAAYAVWARALADGQVAVLASVRPAGATGWDPPQELSSGQSPSTSVTVAALPAGGAVAAWTGRVGSSTAIQIARRAAGAAGWSAPTAVSEAGQNALEPALAVDSTGAAAVAWRRYDGRFFRVQLALCGTDGACATPLTLSPAGGSAVNPRVGVDDAGTVHVLWRRFGATSYRLQAVARRPAGTLSPVQTVSILSAVDPSLAVSPGGEAVATWRTYGRGERIQAAARLSADGVWSTPTDLGRSGAGAFVRTPRIAIDPVGNALVVWERSGTSGDRLDAARKRLRTTAFAPAESLTAAGDLVDPALALDAAGAARALVVGAVRGGRAVLSSDRPPG